MCVKLFQLFDNNVVSISFGFWGTSYYSQTINMMMPVLDDKKVERTSTKQAIMAAAKHLKTGCEYKMGSVGAMASKLDTAFCDFVEVDTEYREMCIDGEVRGDYLVVNSLDLDNYEQSVQVVACFLVVSLMSLTASLMTTSRMQQCFNVMWILVFTKYFLFLYHCCILSEMQLTTTTKLWQWCTPEA